MSLNETEHQQNIETLHAVAALAPLVKELYASNEVAALNTVTNTIRAALANTGKVSLNDTAEAVTPKEPAADTDGAGIASEQCNCIICTMEAQRTEEDDDALVALMTALFGPGKFVSRGK